MTEKPKSIYDQFQTSEDREKGEGIVLDYGEFGKFRIHRAGGANRRYATLWQAKLKPFTRQIQTETMDDEVFNRLAVETFARTIIIGWEGVVARDGSGLPFTEENCIRLMTDLPDLFRDIQAAAQNRSLFLAAAHADAEGN